MTTLSAKSKALRLLARREHSRKELERKLLSTRGSGPGARGGPDSGSAAEVGEAQQRRDEVNSALDALEHCGLLSDTRAAESLLAAKAPRFGSRRLKQLLQAKSLDPSLVSDTLARAHETEFERAQQVWERRFDAPASTLQGRAKQQRFLAGRGFDAAVIDRVLKAAGQLSVAAFGDDTHSFTPDD